MRAARLHEGASELTVEDVPDPELRPGSAIVRIETTFVSPSVADMTGENSSYITPPRPFTPGMDAIATVEAVADDVAGLEIGQRVYCDSYYESHNVSAPGDMSFLGYFGMGRDSPRLLARWPDGSYAEKLLLPAECFTPLGAAEGVEPALLCRLGWLGTAYGGLVRAGLNAGDTVVIPGATGLVGTSGVLVALAMGAARIIALGRKQGVLDELAAMDPERISAVNSVEAKDLRREVSALADGADVVLDAMGETDDTDQTEAAIRALRRGGTAAVVGGLGADLPVSYQYVLIRALTIKGSIWFPRRAAAELLAMIGRGVLDLGALRPQRFPLAGVNAAIAKATERPGGLDHIAICPES
jgi:alcohol dehydrogenase